MQGFGMGNHSGYHHYHGCVRGLWLLVAILLTALPISDGGSDYFAPGGTRTFPYSSKSCKRLRLNDESSKYPATLYLLHDKPKLTAYDNFTINVTPTLKSGHYMYWRYYLYRDSIFSMKYCLIDSQSSMITFYLILKESNFIAWVGSHDLKYTTDHRDIFNSCDQGKDPYYYLVTDSEEYYFVFYGSGIFESAAQASMQINRALYNPNSSKIVKKCEADPNSESNSASCSVDVPYRSDYPALIVVGTPPNTNYTDTVHIEWYCRPRGSEWLLLPTVIIPVVAAGACVAVISCACCYYWRRRRKVRTHDQPLIE